MEKETKTKWAIGFLACVLVFILGMGYLSYLNDKETERREEILFQLKEDALKANRLVPSMKPIEAKNLIVSLEATMMQVERDMEPTDSEQFQRILSEVNEIIIKLHSYVSGSNSGTYPFGSGKTYFF